MWFVGALRTGAAIVQLAACGDLQSVQLGELATSSAGAPSASQDEASRPALDTSHDSGTPHAPTDPPTIDAGAMVTDPDAPDPSQPSAADAGAHRPDARIDPEDVDDDDDEDSEESPESAGDDEDAGEPSDD